MMVGKGGLVLWGDLAGIHEKRAHILEHHGLFAGIFGVMQGRQALFCILGHAPVNTAQVSGTAHGINTRAERGGAYAESGDAAGKLARQRKTLGRGKGMRAGIIGGLFGQNLQGLRLRIKRLKVGKYIGGTGQPAKAHKDQYQNRTKAPLPPEKPLPLPVQPLQCTARRAKRAYV